MQSSKIEEWFNINESLFEGLDKCRKYFELIDGEISEFRFVHDDLINRFDFTVTSSLTYAKAKKISIAFDKINGTLENYYQKEIE